MAKPKPEYRSTFLCAQPGCREVQVYVYSRREDEKARLAWQLEHPFSCTRHADPARNLRPGNETARRMYVVTDLRPELPGGLLSWVPEGGGTGSGFLFGPNFNAHAADFPEGTRLVVTAEILPPGE